MKLFVAENELKRRTWDNGHYHWANPLEPLMFGIVPSNEPYSNKEVKHMIGMNSAKATTRIMVKDTKYTKIEVIDMIIRHVDKKLGWQPGMKSFVNKDGFYKLNFNYNEDGMKNLKQVATETYNVYDIYDELTKKASKFKDGELILVKNRNVKRRKRWRPI